MSTDQKSVYNNNVGRLSDVSQYNVDSGIVINKSWAQAVAAI